MTSHAKPCYHELSSYTKNGIKTIVAPTPVETKPLMFDFFKPHAFSQKDYHTHLKQSGFQNIPRNNNEGYSKISNIGCANENNDPSQFSNHYTFQPRFNDVTGPKRYY